MDKNFLAILKDVAEKDESFVVNVCEAKSVEEVCEILKSHNIELDETEMKSFFEELQKERREELSEVDLENISGGGPIGLILCGAAFLYGVYRSWKKGC